MPISVLCYEPSPTPELGNIGEYLRAKGHKRLPTVLTKEEVQNIMKHLSGVEHLIVQLLYGSGLRLAEALNLRVKDVDFAQNQLIIRDTKGKEDRVTPLLQRIQASLKEHLQTVQRLHRQDLERGYRNFGLKPRPFRTAF